MKILCVFGRYAYGSEARGTGYEYAHFIPSLRRLGHDVEFFESFDRSAWRDFAELNTKLVERVLELGPDVVLFVLMGYEVWTETLDLLRASTRAVLVNWSTDDSWKYAEFSRWIASHFDRYVTTYPAAVERAERDGRSNFRLSQWAAGSDALAEPLPASECEYPVSFVGACYGNRPEWIRALRARGVDVHCFGHGWPAGPVPADAVPRIMRRSRISLNFADSGRVLSGWRMLHSRQIKARTFEVPGAGGCLFTEPAEGLERYYVPGEEIVVFRDADDLAGKIGRFLENDALRDALAGAGHRRTRRDHTYESRFADILADVEALRAARGEPAVNAQAALSRVRALADAHAIGAAHRLLRAAFTFPFASLWGARRGARAARRALFELSWRFAGACTYSARGLPGRLFYRES